MVSDYGDNSLNYMISAIKIGTLGVSFDPPRGVHTEMSTKRFTGSQVATEGLKAVSYVKQPARSEYGLHVGP